MPLQHPCTPPVIWKQQLGETWQCPHCGAGWILAQPTIGDRRWERTSWTRPYVD